MGVGSNRATGESEAREGSGNLYRKQGSEWLNEVYQHPSPSWRVGLDEPDSGRLLSANRQSQKSQTIADIFSFFYSSLILVRQQFSLLFLACFFSLYSFFFLFRWRIMYQPWRENFRHRMVRQGWSDKMKMAIA